MQISERMTPNKSVSNGRRLGRIMIVEDDALLSMMMEDMVRELGAEDVFVCNDHAAAARAARDADIDCGILDVFVRAAPTYDVADILGERGIPFIFCSGITQKELDERHRHRPFLSKPYSDNDLRDCLTRAMAAIEDRVTSAPG